MTFKQLANELMGQGWRCYEVKNMDSLIKGDNLKVLAIRNLIEIQVYEGKSLVFVKDSKPVEKKKSKT